MELIEFITSLKWQDVVDILLNSYLLFRLYVLFRGSRFVRAVPVVGMLWLLKEGAMAMGLVVTSWAIQGIMAAAALILIIVFRDEIATVFQAKNLKSFLWGFPSHRVHSPIENIVESVYELGRKKTGALLVFPRKKKIGNLIQGGLAWNGSISKEMLLSIFFDGNPVHDGAAVIRGDQVTDVGVILPLSKRDDLPSKYGTRHRAAIGLSEASDALVVVVSEESGNVTAVKNDDIIDVKNNVELEAILKDHTGTGTDQESNRVKETTEFGLAGFACFLLITILWFGLSRGKETITTITVPVEYTDIGQNFEIIEVSANNVSLHLSGSKTLIKSLRTEQIKVLLELSNASSGNNSYTITNEDVVLPPGVSLKKVEPVKVDVLMDKTINKKLPVQPDWTGKMPEGLILENAVIVPEFIEVTGGKNILDNITTLYTEKIQLDSIRKTGTISVGVALSPASLKFAEGAKKTVLMRCKVKSRSIKG